MIDDMLRILSIVVLVFTGCAGSPPEKPPMSPVLQKIVKHKDAKPAPAATEKAIEQVAARFKHKLPEQLLELWRHGDGIVFDRFRAKLIGPSEALENLNNKVWFQFEDWELLPILDFENSDYLCICVGDPVKYRIMHVPHDDGPSLKYRDLNAFLVELSMGLDGEEMAEYFFHDRAGDYAPNTKRTPEDQVAAKALLAIPEGTNHWNIAIQLLDDSEPELWRNVLESGKFGVRDEALRYLRKITSPRLKELYEQDQRELAAFCDQAEQAVIKAGLPLKERKGNSLNINGQWLSLNGWFPLRNDPNVFKLLTDPKRYE